MHNQITGMMAMSDEDMVRRGDVLKTIEALEIARCASCGNPRNNHPFRHQFVTESALDMKAAIDAIPSVQVGVKPLEWIKHPSKDIWRATVGLGVYKAFGITSPSWDFDSWSDAKDKVSQSAPTIEAAKAAAQADYEARIRSALTTQPSPDVAALVEAMVTIRCAILEALRSSSDMDYCLNLSGLAARTDLPRETLRGIIADMRAEGLVSYHKGLWSEEGTPGGAGYAITDDGRAALARVKGSEA